MDKPTAVAALTKRLAPRVLRELTWAQFAAAVTGLSADDKAAILRAVQGAEARTLGEVLLAHVRDHVRSLAASEADTLLADDAISLAELDQVL